MSFSINNNLKLYQQSVRLKKEIFKITKLNKIHLFYIKFI